MLFIWMILAGLIPSLITKLVRPADQIGRLFILGITGSFLAAAMLYSERMQISFVASFIGASVMLFLYMLISETQIAERSSSERLTLEAEEDDHDDFRKAA